MEENTKELIFDDEDEFGEFEEAIDRRGEVSRRVGVKVEVINQLKDCETGMRESCGDSCCCACNGCWHNFLRTDDNESGVLWFAVEEDRLDIQ